MKKVTENMIIVIAALAAFYGACWFAHWVMSNAWLTLLTVGLVLLMTWAAYEGWQRARNLDKDDL